jgi:hypothetical protein
LRSAISENEYEAEVNGTGPMGIPPPVVEALEKKNEDEKGRLRSGTTEPLGHVACPFFTFRL